MAEHTRGPWLAFQVNVRDNWKASKPIYDDGLWRIVRGDDVETCPIAEVDRGDDHDAPTRQQAEADARLIAAAPELLRLMTRLVEITPHRTLDKSAPLYLEMRAAIAKATTLARTDQEPTHG